MSCETCFSPTICWPQKYLPGTTDNYVSNEIYTSPPSQISITTLWSLLSNPLNWPSYYSNVSDITPLKSLSEPKGELQKGDKFRFATFGFPALQAECMESVPPEDNSERPSAQEQENVARLAWRAWRSYPCPPEEKLDVYHAWLLEDLGDGRIRILTQESQIGEPAKKLRNQRPNPMLNGHQEWLEGLVRKAGNEMGKEEEGEQGKEGKAQGKEEGRMDEGVAWAADGARVEGKKRAGSVWGFLGEEEEADDWPTGYGGDV